MNKPSHFTSKLLMVHSKKERLRTRDLKTSLILLIIIFSSFQIFANQRNLFSKLQVITKSTHVNYSDNYKLSRSYYQTQNTDNKNQHGLNLLVEIDEEDELEKSKKVFKALNHQEFDSTSQTYVYILNNTFRSFSNNNIDSRATIPLYIVNRVIRI